MREFTMYFLGGILALTMGVWAIVRFAWMNVTYLEDEEVKNQKIPPNPHDTHTLDSEDLEEHKKVA